MKIVAINGSHNGKNGNTHIMVTSFLKGAQDAGAETVNICLADKEIKHCKACKVCWFHSPGHCIIKDDMAEILPDMEGADVLVLATPLYVDNISGMMKVFMDRRMVMASPYWGKDEYGESRHLPLHASPKIILISNCGYPERSHFQVISHWIQRVARNMHTEVIGEIYASQGALLRTQLTEVRPVILKFLQTLETAGREIVTNMKLSEETQKLLEQNFIPDEIYIQNVNRYVDNMLKK